MKANKLLFLISALCVILTLMSVTVFAGEAVNVYDRATLKAALENDNVDSITLTDNISLSGEAWVPITINVGRTLEINGNEKTISDMTVREYLLVSDGQHNATGGHSADYRAGFIGYNRGNLTIRDLTFTSGDVDISPTSSESDGSSQLGVVCGMTEGALILTNVTVSDCVVKGYTKVGALLGHLYKGDFTANKCTINNTQVILEADGADTHAGYSALILGCNQTKTAKTNGIKIVNSTSVKDVSVIWDNYEEKVAPKSKATYIQYTDVICYGLTAQTYKKNESKPEAVQFVAEIDGYQYETLEDALVASVSGDVIKLIADIELTSTINFNYDKTITIDLNGKILTTTDIIMCEITNGSITLADNASEKGKVHAPNDVFYVWGGETKGKLVIEAGVVVKSDTDCCVVLKDKGAILISEGELSTNSTDYGAIQGNGKLGGIEVYINGGTVSAPYNTAIYFPSKALLQISDGIISGKVAVYQKSGKMVISGGKFNAFGEKAAYVYDKNGCKETGDAIVIESCDYPDGAPVVEIAGGYFSSENNQAVASYVGNGISASDRIVKFISGGYYTSDPTEFLVKGKVAVESDEPGYEFMVADKNANIEVETVVEVIDSVIVNTASVSLSGDVEVNSTDLASAATNLANDSSIIDSEAAITAIATEFAEKYVEGETVVTVVVQAYMDINITGYEESKSLTLEISPKYNLIATMASGEEAVTEGENAVVLKAEQDFKGFATPIEIKIPLPEGFVTDGVDVIYIHHEKEDMTYIYEAQVTEGVSGDVAVFTNPNGFSTFVVKTESEGVVKNNDTGVIYTTLEDAVKEVEDKEVIKLLVDNGETVEVARDVEFGFDLNGKTFSGDIVPGENTTVKKTEDDTTGLINYLFDYTKPQPSISVGGGGSTHFTVKFETNGGTKIDDKRVMRLEKLDWPTVPTKVGFTFDGWYKDEACTELYNFDSRIVKNFTLYAKWKDAKEEKIFDDVDSDDWFYDAVKYAVENKLFNGISNTQFAPMMEINRAMLVTVLYRYEGEPEVKGASKFEDVVSGSYYEKAVIWAESKGIVNGVSDSRFAPENKITREQIVAIMFRFANYKGMDTSVGENTNILSYEDIEKVSEYAIPAMQWAVGSGLMKGKTNVTLNPTDTATRAEVATILQRFIESI